MHPGITEDTPLNEIGLSVRVANCFKNYGCVTVGDALRFTDKELLITPNFGKVSLREWKQAIGIPEEQYYSAISNPSAPVQLARQSYPVNVVISLNFIKEDGTQLLAGDIEQGTEIILTPSNGIWAAKVKPPPTTPIKTDCADGPKVEEALSDRT